METVKEKHKNTILIYQEDCNNAPRKKIIKNMVSAILKDDQEFAENMTADDIVCDVVGNRTYFGKTAIAELFSTTHIADIEELHIMNIITHGKFASMGGTVKTNKQRRYAFSGVFRFSGAVKTAKLKHLSLYIIKEENQEE